MENSFYKPYKKKMQYGGSGIILYCIWGIFCEAGSTSPECEDSGDDMSTPLL